MFVDGLRLVEEVGEHECVSVDTCEIRAERCRRVES